MRILLGTLVVSAAMLALSGCAATGEGGREVASLAELGYQANGDETSCLWPRDIRSTKILDNDHILFRMSRNKLYINTLPNSCPTLESEDRFGYTLRDSNLCRGQIINVLSMIGAGPSCSLGEFIPVEAVPEEE